LASWRSLVNCAVSETVLSLAVACDALPRFAGPGVKEGAEDEAPWLLCAPGCAVPVAGDLRARTSRDISRQVRSSVLLDSPPVVANATQCCLSAAENFGHSRLSCSRTLCSLFTHSSKVVLRPAPDGSADWLAIPRQTGRTSRLGIASDRAHMVDGTTIATAIVTRYLCIFLMMTCVT